MSAELINLCAIETVTAKGPENEHDFVARMIWDTFDFMDRGELIAAADRLERASRFLRLQGAAPQAHEERNRERRRRQFGSDDQAQRKAQTELKQTSQPPGPVIPLPFARALSTSSTLNSGVMCTRASPAMSGAKKERPSE